MSRQILFLVFGLLIASCATTSTVAPTQLPPADTPIPTASITPTSSPIPTLSPTLEPTPTPEPTPTFAPPELSEEIQSFCQENNCTTQWDGENWQLRAEYRDFDADAQKEALLGRYLERDGKSLLLIEVASGESIENIELDLDNINREEKSGWMWSRLVGPAEYGRQAVFADGAWHSVEVGPTEMTTPAGVKAIIGRSTFDMLYLNAEGLTTLDTLWKMILTGDDPLEKDILSITTQEVKDYIEENPILDELYYIRHCNKKDEYLESWAHDSPLQACAGKVENVRTDEVVVNSWVAGEGKMFGRMVNGTGEKIGGIFVGVIENDDGTNTLSLNAVTLDPYNVPWISHFRADETGTTYYNRDVRSGLGTIAMNQAAIEKGLIEEIWIQTRLSFAYARGRDFYPKLQELPHIFLQDWIKGD